MNITLYNNIAETNRLNKKDYLTEITTLSGTLRESSSIVAPSILIELDPSVTKSYYPIRAEVMDDDENDIIDDDENEVMHDTKAESDILTANYCYIEEFNRYYFISDIVSVRNNLWRLNLRCDVLMSFSSEIIVTSAFVTRNEFKYNKYLVDSEMILRSNPEIKIEEVVDLSNKFNYEDYGLNYVVTCVTKEG